MAATIAADVLCWLWLLYLDRSLADAETEDVALPDPAHHLPAGPRPTQTQDQIPETWPWTRELEAAFPSSLRPDLPTP